MGLILFQKRTTIRVVEQRKLIFLNPGRSSHCSYNDQLLKSLTFIQFGEEVEQLLRTMSACSRPILYFAFGIIWWTGLFFWINSFLRSNSIHLYLLKNRKDIRVFCTILFFESQIYYNRTNTIIKIENYVFIISPGHRFSYFISNP